MDFLAPTTWADALAAKAGQPDAVPVAGGTDVMVEINFDHRRPPALLDLTRVPELQEWSTEEDGRVRLGAGVTYTRIIDELGDRLPGLAMAARTVGSPQIRNRGRCRDRDRLGARRPAHPRRGVLHGRQAQRARRGRADRRRAHRACRRTAAVLQDRHPERDGDRGVGVRAGPAPAAPRRRHRHRLGGPHTTPSPRRGGFPGRRAGRGRAVGVPRRAARWPRRGVRAEGARRRRPHRRRARPRRAATWAWDDYRRVA
jgi:molybdopterin-dependent oxidoreductase-like protein